VVIGVGVCFALYLATRDRRYLAWAWGIIKFTGVFLLILAVFYLVERLILVL
jgi:hypothetical protein